MSNRTTKTLYTCAWGGYWEKYGKDWIKQVELLNTKPDQIFVVSDKSLSDCPYEVILADPNFKPYPITAFRQAAVDHCNCDWYCFSDIDDIMFPNYLDNINDNYDIHAISFKRTDGRDWILCDIDKRNWNEMFTYEGSYRGPFSGTSFIKSKIIKKVGIPLYGWQDNTLFIKLREINCSVFFDSTPRFLYNIDIKNSLSKIHTRKNKKREHDAILKQVKEKYNEALHFKS